LIKFFLPAAACHSRECGNPEKRRKAWIPAFAGMTGTNIFSNCTTTYGNTCESLPACFGFQVIHFGRSFAMKKLFLFVILSVVPAQFLRAQSVQDLLWQLEEQSQGHVLQGDRYSKDPYPLLIGPIENWQAFQKKNILVRPYNDPGILLPPMNWDCDPGIVWSPALPAPQNSIPTFEQYIPPSLLEKPFITPFLEPGADLLQKLMEIRDAGELKIRE